MKLERPGDAAAAAAAVVVVAVAVVLFSVRFLRVVRIWTEMIGSTQMMKRKAERGERKRTTKKNGMNNGTRRSRSQESRKKDRQTGRQADRQRKEKRERKRGCGTEHCCVLTSKKDSSTGSAAWKSLEGKNGGGPGAGSLGGRECISTTTNNKIYTHTHTYIYIYILENKYKNIYI